MMRLFNSCGPLHLSGEGLVPEQAHEVETLQRGPGSEGQGEGTARHLCVRVRQQGGQRAAGVRV